MYPTALYADSTNNLLYSAGYFTSIDNNRRWGIASWNTDQWDSLGLGIDYDSVSSQPQMTRGFLWDNGYLYTVGSFRRAGTINSNCIARWNGTIWDSVPGCKIAAYQSINDIVKYNGEIYICGSFDSIGSLPAHGLAKWDGNAWHTVANNYDFATQGVLGRIRFYHGRLYVSGMFRDPNGNTCRLARWDGLNWYFMTTEVQGGLADIWDMEVYEDKLYVAGLFFQSAGNAANCLQSWNDTTWCAVGGSIQILSNPYPVIRDLCVYNNKLYCAGNFEMIGGVPANSIALWDGTDWCSLGSTFDNGGITQMAFYQDTLYVVGGFQNVDTVPATYVAKWIGGNYIDACGHLTTNVAGTNLNAGATVFPNPAHNQFTLQFSSSAQRTVVLCDPFGRELLREQVSASQHIINVASFAEGIYFYTIMEPGASTVTGKFIVQH